MKTEKFGFTFIELLVALAGGLLLLLGVLNLFTLGQSAFRVGGNFAEASQNGRIVLERMSRELRQAEELVSALSQNPASPSAEIQFLDGHNPQALNYLRYYLANQTLRREVAFYNLTAAPTVPVHYQDRNPDGSLATKTVTENEIIAEYITAFKLWESGSRLINISLTLTRDNATTNLITALYGRNLH